MPATPALDKTTAADQIINKYMAASAGAGMVPVPLLDTATLTGVQIKMLHGLTVLYELEFSVPIAKTLLSTLAATSFRYTFGRTLLSFAKAIPLLGQLTGSVGMGLLGMASTYATGKAFSYHFEQGGTLHNFDVKAMSQYYQQQLEKGQEVARQSDVIHEA